MSPKIISTLLLSIAAIATVNALSADAALFERGGGYDDQCYCPKDNKGYEGTLINVYPAYQCAYPSGHCTWDDQTGKLHNNKQTNCPDYAPWNGSCPKDNNYDQGYLIDHPKGFQCAYKAGACTWDVEGALVNTNQKNCPTYSKCT